MKFKRLVLSAAVAGAVGAAPAWAAIVGVPGEAGLVPLFMNGANDVEAETYVGLYVPTNIGTDTIFEYTKPNSPSGRQTIPVTAPGAPSEATIYWKTFDPYSKPIDNGECEISLGDKTVWTTDTSYYQEAQRQQDAAFLGPVGAPPSPVCGTGSSDPIGYVVFQTKQGADGQAAPYAFWGNAWIIENVLTAAAATGLVTNVASVPFIPMADGVDGSPAQLPALGNEVISSATLGDGDPSDPAAVSPLAAGTRMTGAIGTSTVRMEAEIRGPLTGNEQSVHVFWFDQNSPEYRDNVQVTIWDDQEGRNTDNIDLSKELNVLLWNNRTDVTDDGLGGTGGFQNFVTAAGYNTPGYYTDVIAAAAAKGNIVSSYSAEDFAEPQYWYPTFGSSYYPGALNGYVTYRFNIEPDVVNGRPGTKTAVAFNWQEVLAVDPTLAGAGSAQTPAINPTAWSSHMTTDLGKQ